MLNNDQKQAVLRALLCEDYHLIHGGPATGKVTTLITILKLLTSFKQKVLLVSNTNQGIDNILLMLKDVGGFDQFIRVTSNTSSVNPEIRPFVKEANGFDSFAEIRRVIDNYQVYGTTCNQIGNPLLLLCGTFDYCIMGDAS